MMVGCAKDTLSGGIGAVECDFDGDCRGSATCVDGECVLIEGDAGVGDPGDVVRRPDVEEPPESNVGDPCDDGDDCSSGYCIEVAEGEGTRVCTDFCDPTDETTCPGGYVCSAVANSGADRVFLCFPQTNFLCRACESDSACGGLSDLCLDLPDGAFCGRSCDRQPCPESFDCVEVEGPEGTSSQCRPTSGTCSGCFDEDGDGYGLGEACLGIDCDERNRDIHEGVAELCNGSDDDCDALIDESLGDNGCGGCEALDGDLGSPCGACGSGRLVCEGQNALRCEAEPGEGEVNDCGGCEALDGEPGVPCGTCGSGLVACDGPESVVCAGDQGERALNGCGGCEALADPPRTACGRCGLDRFECRGQDNTACDGDTAVNNCGGCNDLRDEPNTACGVCGDGRFVCNGPDAVRCDDPPPPAESCNLFDDDCDGAIDEGINGGCKVNVHRSVHPNTGEHFYTVSATEARCCGYILESQNYYALYRRSAPGLVPFYRCFANARHFYTTSSNCEILGAGARESIMGYIAPNPVPSAVQLYRAYNSRLNDHLYTTSLQEFNNAIRNGGYSGEPIAGWVFPVD